jgi:alpha-1,2-mannosyltransferase
MRAEGVRMTGALTRRWPLPTVLALIGATAAFTATVPLFRDWFDLYVYYGTVHSWVWHGGRIYDFVMPGTHYGFTYPPFAAVAMLPLALMSRPVAVGAALALNVAAAGVVLRTLLGRMPHWTGYAVVGCLFILLEPVRDTFSFGQVNLVLLALVLRDDRLGRFSGVATGLAAAFKLTPALFLVHLLLTGRRREAATGTLTALVATAAGWLLAPGPSRDYWSHALWDTSRVGITGYVSNQSLRGALSRLGDPGGAALWALAVLVVLGVWAVRVRRTDHRTGIALTGVAACLVSPVTWVHHLVWLLPALALLVRSRRNAAICIGYPLLCSSLVWIWRFDASGPLGFLGSNAYVWLAVWLLVALRAAPEDTGGQPEPVRHEGEPGAPPEAATGARGGAPAADGQARTRLFRRRGSPG